MESNRKRRSFGRVIRLGLVRPPGHQGHHLLPPHQTLLFSNPQVQPVSLSNQSRVSFCFELKRGRKQFSRTRTNEGLAQITRATLVHMSSKGAPRHLVLGQRPGQRPGPRRSPLRWLRQAAWLGSSGSRFGGVLDLVLDVASTMRAAGCGVGKMIQRRRPSAGDRLVTLPASS